MFPYKEKVAKFHHIQSTKLITLAERAREKEQKELLHDILGALVQKL